MPTPPPSPQPASAHPAYATLEPLLSPQRLARYTRAMDGSQRGAVQLYKWGMDMSGAVHEALYTIEVVLRNAMDTRLRVWNAAQIDRASGHRHSGDWLLDPAKLLVRLIRPTTLDEARRRAGQAIAAYNRPLQHSDVLTQLTFGAWRFLLPDHDPGRQHLWREALHKAFPHLSAPPSQLVAAVDGIYKLRNKCAHMESLLDGKNIRRQYQNMRSVLRAIDPAADQWFTSTQRITAVLRDRPGP